MRFAPMLASAAVVLAGCGGGPGHPARHARAHPPASTTPALAQVQRTTSALAQARRTHELPTPAPPQAVPGGWRDPVQAVEVFAQTYINWTAATVVVRLRALAEVSIGQARSALSLAAGEAARDYELRRGGIANRGVVEAIAPVRGHGSQYAVVTREQTTATNSSAYQGLAAAWHVALATVTRVQDGLWVLSAWQPES